jgi:hypothetical protein
MKNLFRLVWMTAFMLLLSLGATAQTTNNKQKMSREQFAETQARHIANTLALDDKTTSLLVKTYVEQQKEVWALGPRMKRSKDNNEQETEADIKARFERSQKLLDIREKYYKRYSTFLTQKQIQRMYEIERQTMHRLQARAQGRPNGKKRSR